MSDYYTYESCRHGYQNLVWERGVVGSKSICGLLHRWDATNAVLMEAFLWIQTMPWTVVPLCPRRVVTHNATSDAAQDIGL